MKRRICPKCYKVNDYYFNACKKCYTPIDKAEVMDFPDSKAEEEFEKNAKARMEEKAKAEAEEAARIYAEDLHEKDELRKKRIQATREKLKSNGDLGFYDYKVVSLSDAWGGRTDTDKLQKTLSLLGRDGWRLVCSFTNEVGKNAMSVANIGTNATVDEAILIFERYVPFD